MAAEITKVDREMANKLWDDIFTGWDIVGSDVQKEKIAQTLADSRSNEAKEVLYLQGKLARFEEKLIKIRSIVGEL